MPSEHDVRQRAVICQDCWFWKEMSCALASPVDGLCANKRPVQGRRSMPQPAQAALVPLAAGHAMEDVAAHAAPVHAPVHASVHASPVPFPTDAPEATFTIAQLRATPPSFREIRAGRAAAASRPPTAEVRIPVGEIAGETLLSDAARQEAAADTAALPCMDSLVERVRQRTAARLNRAGAVVSA